MGYELARFVEPNGQGEATVDEELICPICSEVLREPVYTPQCEHAFCRDCIQTWLERTPACPIDRIPITQEQQLKPVPRLLRTLLSRLTLSCAFVEDGCTALLKVDGLEAHEATCEYNPSRPVPCTDGCGLIIPKDHLKDHSCIRELREVTARQQARIADMERQLEDHWSEICRLKSMLDSNNIYQFCRRTADAAQQPSHSHLSLGSAESNIINNNAPVGTSSPLNADFALLQESNDQLAAWSSRLPGARVTRWGGMISTPDRVLQLMVKRALLETGCPVGAIQELIDNAHECRWPPGLSTLETRQRNRRLYESFVCKRIPGKQAVVVLACDNRHMGSDMIIYPGLVMIFAHGIW